jgi:CMP-N-acetylneuraminic acid synthetase
MKAVIVVPARWASTRFPGKPLAPIAGVSLIERVYSRATASHRASAVYVATDDERIHEHVAGFGGKVVRPEGEFHSGTDRIAAALPLIETKEGARFDVVVNVQGDEPLIDIASVDALIDILGEREMATLACPLETDEEHASRDIVKVVTASASRSTSPAPRSPPARRRCATSASTPTAGRPSSSSSPSRPPRWSGRNHSSSCGLSSRALELPYCKPLRPTSASTDPRTWRASRVSLRNCIHSAGDRR